MLSEFRLLTPDLISHLLPAEPGQTTGQGLRRRLWLLWQAGFLDRPRQQRYLVYQGPGKCRELVYALGDKGAKVLASQGPEQFGHLEVDWYKKNLELKETTIEHELAISRFRVALLVSHRHQRGVRLEHCERRLANAGRVTCNL